MSKNGVASPRNHRSTAQVHGRGIPRLALATWLAAPGTIHLLWHERHTAVSSLWVSAREALVCAWCTLDTPQAIARGCLGQRREPTPGLYASAAAVPLRTALAILQHTVEGVHALLPTGAPRAERPTGREHAARRSITSRT